MENNLMEIGKRFHQIKSRMLNAGYTGEMLENHITDVISNEILSELGYIERYEEVKRAMVNMFFLGQISKETFTRQGVIKIIDELLQRPDILIDAVGNEMSNHDAESLLEFVEKLGV